MNRLRAENAARAAAEAHLHLPHSLKPLTPHMAMGGTVLRAGAVEVGERGPEVLSLPEGAQVTPLAPGSLTDNRDIVVRIDGKELARINLRQALISQASGA